MIVNNNKKEVFFILSMTDEELWDKIVQMDVGTFLKASDLSMNIREICHDYAYGINDYQMLNQIITPQEEQYISESMERTILNESISSFIEPLKRRVKIQRRR